MLRQAVESVSSQHIPEKKYLRSSFASLSRWQFGTDAWLDGLRVGGKPPRWMLMQGKQQVAQWHPDSGRFSFTKSILEKLRETGTLREVEIGGNDAWKGDIFAPMVISAPSDLRIGEEILVIRDGKLLGSARCMAAGWEWKGGVGRLAKSQHRL